MTVEMIVNLLVILFVIASLHRRFFEWYTSVASGLVKIAVALLATVIRLIPKFSVASLKFSLVLTLVVVLILMYTLTSFIPFIGKRLESLRNSIRYQPSISDFSAQMYKMRMIMIRVVAEENGRDLRFEEAAVYRSELSEVKENGKRRLESGETLLSVSLGLILLIGQIMGIRLLQSSIYIIPVSRIVEVWLLSITVSIIYRTSVLESLCYASDSKFESLDQMDAALSYQRGISFAGIIQGLTFIVVFVAAITRVKHDLVEDVLRRKYTGEDWVAFAWDRLTD